RRVLAGRVSISSNSQIYPSSFRTCAMPRRMFEAGMSRMVRSIRTALRIRVSISAIGAVIMGEWPSLTAAGNAPGRVGDEVSRTGGRVGAAGEQMQNVRKTHHGDTRANATEGSVGPVVRTRGGLRPGEPTGLAASLPARLLHPWDQAAAGQVAEADP